MSFRSDDRRGPFGRGFQMRPTKETHAKYFPVPIPKQLFPPPPGFEHPRAANPATFEASTKERIGALLSAIQDEGKTSRAIQAASTSTRRQKDREQLRAFRQWIDTVGHPVFQAFVDALMASGQDARILRASSPVDDFSFGTESIELRLRIASASQNGFQNPDYRRPGHVRVSVAGDASRVSVEVEPRMESSNRYGPPVAVNEQPPTKQQLEQTVLEMLARIRSDK